MIILSVYFHRGIVEKSEHSLETASLQEKWVEFLLHIALFYKLQLYSKEMQAHYPKEEKKMKEKMGNGKEAQKFASTSLSPFSISGPILPWQAFSLKTGQS